MEATTSLHHSSPPQLVTFTLSPKPPRSGMIKSQAARRFSGHSPDHSKVSIQDLSLSLSQSTPSLAFAPVLCSRIISSEPVSSPSPSKLI